MFGWSKPDKSKLQGHLAVVVNGHRFVIRRVNAWLDFTEQNMPQIFTAFVPRRKAAEVTLPTEKQIKRIADDMRVMLEAGLVEPALVPVGQGEKRGHEDGITVDDILRDEESSQKLYWAIVAHSLNRYKGLRGLFFSIKLKYALWMSLQSATPSSPTSSPLPTGSSA